MDLCRSKGVREITIDGVHFKIEPLPEAKPQPEITENDKEFLGYTDEQLLEWSSGN